MVAIHRVGSGRGRLAGFGRRLPRFGVGRAPCATRFCLGGSAGGATLAATVAGSLVGAIGAGAWTAGAARRGEPEAAQPSPKRWADPLHLRAQRSELSTRWRFAEQGHHRHGHDANEPDGASAWRCGSSTRAVRGSRAIRGCPGRYRQSIVAHRQRAHAGGSHRDSCWTFELERHTECIGKLFGRLEASRGITRCRFQPPRIDLGRERGQHLARHRNGIEHDLAEQLAEPVADERKITGEALVGDDRERPEDRSARRSLWCRAPARGSCTEESPRGGLLW